MHPEDRGRLWLWLIVTALLKGGCNRACSATMIKTLENGGKSCVGYEIYLMQSSTTSHVLISVGPTTTVA
jgi:hypothetical protein